VTDRPASVRFLSIEELLLIAHVATGGEPAVRDLGLLDSALHRPQTTLFGEDAYSTIWDKGAALLESIVRHHALVDGNKRTGWLAICTFLEANGRPVDAPTDEAFDLIVGIAEGRVEVAEAAAALERWCRAD
jgi:death on curing protein